MLNLEGSYPFYRKKNYQIPELGLNTRFDPITLQDTEAVQLENYQVNNKGILEKYPGYILDGSPFPNNALSFIRLLYNFRRGATVNSLIIAADDETNNVNTTYSVDVKSTIGDGTYQYLTYGIGTATFVANNTSVTGQNTSWTKELRAGDKIKLASDTDSKYTEIATVNSDTSLTLVAGGYLGTSGSTAVYLARKIWNKNNKLVAISYNNICALSDGDRAPQQFDGTNIIGLINSYSGTTITVQANAAPKVKYFEVFKNRLFGADDINLYWSHAEDQTFWDPASQEPIMPEDGGVIIGIKAFADSIFVFKNNGYVYRVFGNFDDSAFGTAAYINRVDYSEKIGLIASKSICIHGSLLFFVAQTGIYRIDQRGVMSKITYNIDPTINNFLFAGGSTVPKTFSFANTAQWTMSATLQGTYSNPNNQNLQSFFDTYRQTDALQGNNLCSIAIDTNNTLHVAYVPSSNAQQINYIKYYYSGFSPTAGSNPQKETNVLPIQAVSTITGLSIGVNPTNGVVGICYCVPGNDNMFFIERSADSGPTLGTWGSSAAIGGSASSDLAYLNSFTYSSGGVPCVAWVGAASGNTFLGYSQRNSGIWSSVQISFGGGGSLAVDVQCSLVLDSSNNIYISYMPFGTSEILAYKSLNGGVSFTNIETFSLSTAADALSNIQGYIDHAGNFHTVYLDTGSHLIDRNHTGTSSTTIDSTANQKLRGYVHIYQTLNAINMDVRYYYETVGTSPNQAEKIVYETSNSISNSSTNTINISSNRRASSTPMVNNGQTMAMIAFGTNPNEIVINRISPYGYWQSPENSDVTLTAWGTFVITGASAGANYTYQIALSSSHPASSFNSITNGAIISSNAALIYNIPRIIFALTGWGGISVTSLVLNYTGTGVSPIDIFGLSYYNELFFTAATSSQTADSFVLGLDIKNSFFTVDYAMNCLESFNTFLYGGSATNGNLFKLKQGYLFNGAEYTSTFVSKEDFISSVEEQKDLFGIYVLFKVQPNGLFNFAYRLDNYQTVAGSAYKTVTIDQSKEGIHFIKIGQNAHSIQYMVQDAVANNYSAVLGWILIYRPLELRQ